MELKDQSIVEYPTQEDLMDIHSIEVEAYTTSEATELETFKDVINSLGSDGFYQMKKATIDGETAGFYCVVNEDGLCSELVDIAVSKKFRGKGIGAVLLKEAINSVPKTTKLLELAVNEKNESAISLYKKFGFDEVGKEHGYYENGDNALFFSLRLGSN